MGNTKATRRKLWIFWPCCIIVLQRTKKSKLKMICKAFSLSRNRYCAGWSSERSMMQQCWLSGRCAFVPCWKYYLDSLILDMFRTFQAFTAYVMTFVDCWKRQQNCFQPPKAIHSSSYWLSSKPESHKDIEVFVFYPKLLSYIKLLMWNFQA